MKIAAEEKISPTETETGKNTSCSLCPFFLRVAFPDMSRVSPLLSTIAVQKLLSISQNQVCLLRQIIP